LNWVLGSASITDPSAIILLSSFAIRTPEGWTIKNDLNFDLINRVAYDGGWPFSFGYVAFRSWTQTTASGEWCLRHRSWLLFCGIAAAVVPVIHLDAGVLSTKKSPPF
jgi:hypothetical protein